ncbi:MAG: SDR family oxidoreductase [Pseudomonadota bacterium]
MTLPNGLPLPEPGPLPKTALVTGGAGALGFEIAKVLSASNEIALLDVGESALNRACELPNATGFGCDVGDSDALHTAYLAAFQKLGPIGIVVHAAGTAPIAPFLDTDRATFEDAINLHLTAGFEIFRLAARDLVLHGKSGRLVAIASISGARAGYARTAYGTAKAGLIHLCGQIALELGPYGITANAVAPGPVDTPLSREAHTAEARADYQRTIPMARYGEAAEVARAVAFLASAESSYISGQTLFVDGGYMASGMGVTVAQSAAAVRRA